MKLHVSDTTKQVAFFVVLILAGAAVGWFLIPSPKEPSPASRSTAADSGSAGAPGRGEISEINQATFDQQVLVSSVPVLVEFYADWCVPCQQLAPVLDEVARENANARVVRVNVEENSTLAERYGVTAIPRLLVFKDGRIISDATGAVGKAQLAAMLKP